MSSSVDVADCSVLVVAADDGLAATCRDRLEGWGSFQITTAASIRAAIEHLDAAGGVDCVVTDHDAPDVDGIALLEAVRARSPELPVVLFTDAGSETVASRAISAGVTEYVVRGEHADEWDRLATVIDDAVRYYREHATVADPEAQVTTLLDAARDTIALVRDGRIEYCNQAGTALFGLESTEAAIGVHVGELLSLDDAASADGRDLVDRIAAVQAGEDRLDGVDATLAVDAGLDVGASSVTAAEAALEVTATKVSWLDPPAAALVVRDVTDRRVLADDLALKERAMDDAPVGITIADATRPDEPLVYVNEAFERITGVPVEEAVGRNCRFLQGEGTREEPVAALREAIEAEEPVTVELRNYRRDGTEFWNRVTIAPLFDDEGSVSHYVGFQQDVTERKTTERSLERFRRAVEAAGHAVYMTDPDGTITYVNPAFEEITGYDAEAAIGRTPEILNSGEMPSSYFEALWESILDGEVWSEEVVNRRASGELYYGQQTIAPITDADGEVSAFVAVQIDVTEQKEREERLRHYERAIEGASDLIAAVDTDLEYLFANEAYRTFHGLEGVDLRGVGLETVLPDVLDADEKEDVLRHVRAVLDGETVHYQMTRTDATDTAKTFEIHYYPLEPLGADEIVGVVATMRDVTAQREREQQLVVLDRLLRHNLHNDLNVVLGYAETIAAETSGDLEHGAEQIVVSARRLLDQADKQREIVDLLADPPSHEAVDVVSAVRRVVANASADHPEATLAVEAPDEVVLRTVPALERAIEELVENALVHDDGDAATVRVSVVDAEDAVEVRVADDGPGIPEAERAILDGEEEIDPLLHGSGMGLWLVDRIAGRAGGSVQFEACDSTGSVVTIVLPRSEDEALPREIADR
ncbi:sensor box histidine kinase [Salinarchaeum sp. Harcht-Bsk1]|uniref:PAS domain S-box protein n=1 Tax=Salinarchaeum sp. Harcht-Bsk1 TaxID=1333523 RepID=UPI00034230E5|nr:PAS domain S-box protein [Salinarchaeum sp. Harcht-Bsk1]AGN01356.1 sensor box histidine kinase [Salinarchaeum sp. Harcht-Bsk1]